MAKQNQNFSHEIYKFLHKPIRQQDQAQGRQFVERYTFAFQRQFEQAMEKINKLSELYDPARTPQPRYLKDIVGFTKELDNITNDISDSDLRKLISLAVALWKQKGLETGYKNIIRLFTGKNSRVFNWFDYRLIVGEKSFGEEQLGEDSWIISKTGVYGTAPTGNVVLLLPFENVLRDRSIKTNDVVPHGSTAFGMGGAVGSSEWHLRLMGGWLTLPNHVDYNFSGNFTIEAFIKTTVAQNAVLFRKEYGTKSVELRYNSLTNQISWTVTDGVSTFTQTLNSTADLDDGLFRHVALIVDRSNGARLYLGGSEATPILNVSTMGNPTNDGEVFIGAKTTNIEKFNGEIDNFRLSLSAQYNVTLSSLPVPGVSFVEYQAEQLDEFYSDVRVVDDGTLNRQLTRRILNLMRPISERLRVIYIRLFEDFQFGKGDFSTVVTGSFLQGGNLYLPSGAVEVCDSLGSENWQDLVVQIRCQIDLGSAMGVRFLVQDSQNYYLFKVDVSTQQATLYKVVGGVASVLGAPVTVPIFDKTFYVLTVITDYSPELNQILLKTHLDSNVIHSVVDSTFVQGPFGIESSVGTTTIVSDVEAFEIPLEYDVIEPGSVV